MPALDFRAFFDATPSPYLVLDADLRIVSVNCAFLTATSTARDEIIDRDVFDVFPNNPDDPVANGVQNLRASLLRVLQTQCADTMAIQKYDIRVNALPEVRFEERYWSPINTPVFDTSGTVTHIIHRVEDVTEFVKARERNDRMKATICDQELEIEIVNRRLRDANEDLEQRVAARTAAQSRTEDALRQADRFKDEFLAMLAHELRNPLAPVAAAAELLTLGRADQARIGQISGIITRQVRHMTGLIDDLLDVSRVTRGQVKLDKILIDAKKILPDAVEQVRPLIETLRHSLTVHTPPEVAFVFGDVKRLVQVIANLVNNAAKYTPEGGDIVLSLQVTDSDVRIAVSDNGVGIAPALQPNVFDLFTQADRGSDRSQGGLGIGLALVKRLVELHGGSVTVFSEGKGKGSCFVVCLPHADAVVTLPHVLQRGTVLTAPGKRFKVLVVDDNTDAAQLLGMLIEELGHEVFIEYHARQAIERARICKPEVCVLDIGLPEVDGYELARWLRRESGTERSTLIALTGYGQDQDRERAFEAGFDHHFTKPIDIAKLADLLSGITGTPQHN